MISLTTFTQLLKQLCVMDHYAYHGGRPTCSVPVDTFQPSRLPHPTIYPTTFHTFHLYHPPCLRRHAYYTTRCPARFLLSFAPLRHCPSIVRRLWRGAFLGTASGMSSRYAARTHQPPSVQRSLHLVLPMVVPKRRALTRIPWHVRCTAPFHSVAHRHLTPRCKAGRAPFAPLRAGRHAPRDGRTLLRVARFARWVGGIM